MCFSVTLYVDHLSVFLSVLLLCVNLGIMVAGFLTTSVESRLIAFIIKCSSASENFRRLVFLIFCSVELPITGVLFFSRTALRGALDPEHHHPRVPACFVLNITHADSRWFLSLNVHVTASQKALPDNLGVLSYTGRRLIIGVAGNLFCVQLHSQSGRSVSGMVTAFVDPSSTSLRYSDIP
jgi:hypothetical protein